MITETGRALGGAAAIIEIARRIWWAWPLFAASRIPGAQRLFDWIYRRIALRRHCVNGACQSSDRGSGNSDWIVALAAVPGVFFFRPHLPDWLFMWLLALALYGSCKWIAWNRAKRELDRVTRRASAAFLFGWTGMDARGFLGERRSPGDVRRAPLMAVTRFLVGLALLWVALQYLMDSEPKAAAWVGMVGIVLCLHFGVFTLIDFLWRGFGFNAELLMREPLRATSLSGFWGRRWNTAFHRLVREFVFLPSVGRLGLAGATMASFLASGLIHDLVISIPARGGYGLPTLYFLLQGAGVLVERTRVAKGFGCGRGFRGWLFALTFTVAPVFLLFHSPFIENVILPMLGAVRTFICRL